jgi:hypothetical protein
MQAKSISVFLLCVTSNLTYSGLFRKARTAITRLQQKNTTLPSETVPPAAANAIGDTLDNLDPQSPTNAAEAGDETMVTREIKRLQKGLIKVLEEILNAISASSNKPYEGLEYHRGLLEALKRELQTGSITTSNIYTTKDLCIEESYQISLILDKIQIDMVSTKSEKSMTYLVDEQNKVKVLFSPENAKGKLNVNIEFNETQAVFTSQAVMRPQLSPRIVTLLIDKYGAAEHNKTREALKINALLTGISDSVANMQEAQQLNT